MVVGNPLDQPALWKPPTIEPPWRLALYGPVHQIHVPGCVLDPRHHIRTRCALPSRKG